MLHLLLRTVLVSLLIAVPGRFSSAQIAPPSPTAPADSARVLREARSRQAGFERLRRSRLPEKWGSGSSSCDERIGRFCLSHNRGRDDWIPPPEQPIVRTERGALIDFLGGATRMLPGDEWMAGQYVRYLVEGRRFPEAFEAASRCRSAPWWCAALAGFAYHHAALPESADSAFDLALSRMDAPTRVRWTDLTLLLENPARAAYRRLDDIGRRTFEARFWRLADPLFSRPGNELRSEHFSRHVWDSLQERAQPPDGVSWGADLREILIRYGWPSGWERVAGIQQTPGPPAVTTHYASSPQTLLPPHEALLEEAGTGGTWDVEDFRSRTGYNVLLADTVARWFLPIDHQIAFFARDDRALAVAAYELPVDSVSADEPVEAGLGFLPTRDSESAPTVASISAVGPRSVVMASGPAESIVWSLELYIPDIRRLARVREGRDLAPPVAGRLSLSDILLFDANVSLPDSLADVLPHTRSSNRFLPGDSIGLYWEVYGLPPDQEAPLEMSLRLQPASASLLQRLGEGVGLIRPSSQVRLSWREAGDPRPYLSRSLRLAIPDVGPGRYNLELTAESNGQEPVTVQREVIVGRADGR